MKSIIAASLVSTLLIGTYYVFVFEQEQIQSVDANKEKIAYQRKEVLLRSLQNVGQEGARRKHIKKNHSNPGAEGKKIETSQELPRGRNLWNLCPFCNFGSSIPEKKQSKINFGPLYLSRGSSCSEGYRLPFTSLGLNGDLNQSAGGKDIFLCLAKDLGDQGITGFKLVQRSTSCGHGWKLADHSEDLDGNLNQSAGGKDIYLCYSTGRIGSRKLVDVALRQKNSHDSMPPSTPDGLNGNLNQGTIGKEIFLNMFYERNDSRAADDSGNSNDNIH